jgi:UDP-glucose 4-epimerase
MATYLITGGCGFIGLHLCKALLSQGDSVRILDDLSTGSRVGLPPAATFIRGDVADPRSVRQALAGVDGCFHLAAIASVELSNRDWRRTRRTNLTGAITVFDAAAAEAVPVVYASSAAVYGDCADLPLGESSQKRPLSAYGCDKLECELHARAAGEARRLTSVGLRLFNVYGPGQDPKSPYSGVVSIFCERIRRGEPIEIFGDGRRTRDFILVADVVTALLRAMDLRPPGAPVFNICTGRATSVLELARTVASLCSRSLEIHFRPERDREIAHSCGSPIAARLALGLGRATEIRAGLAATLNEGQRP